MLEGSQKAAGGPGVSLRSCPPRRPPRRVRPLQIHAVLPGPGARRQPGGSGARPPGAAGRPVRGEGPRGQAGGGWRRLPSRARAVCRAPGAAAGLHPAGAQQQQQQQRRTEPAGHLPACAQGPACRHAVQRTRLAAAPAPRPRSYTPWPASACPARPLHRRSGTSRTASASWRRRGWSWRTSRSTRRSGGRSCRRGALPRCVCVCVCVCV
jgi:hypothetical protein